MVGVLGYGDTVIIVFTAELRAGRTSYTVHVAFAAVTNRTSNTAQHYNNNRPPITEQYAAYNIGLQLLIIRVTDKNKRKENHETVSIAKPLQNRQHAQTPCAYRPISAKFGITLTTFRARITTIHLYLSQLYLKHYWFNFFLHTVNMPHFLDFFSNFPLSSTFPPYIGSFSPLSHHLRPPIPALPPLSSLPFPDDWTLLPV